MEQKLQSQIKNTLKELLGEIESITNSDVIYFQWWVDPQYLRTFRDFIEELANEHTHTTLSFIIKTPGGSAEMAEKMVEIMRHHYNEIHFIVPEFAMSAGTILCMAWDKIFMDYSSSLGPIDPQVPNSSDWKYVPALWYLDKVDELLAKAKEGTLTEAEYLILKDQDLWRLRAYEQARDLSISLLKEWLVKYKFKDWVQHKTNSIWTPVTVEQKQERAKEIAEMLSDNKRWHVHWRFIGMETLRNELRLEIDDLSSNPDLFKKIRDYSDIIWDFASWTFLHSRKHI